MSKVLINEMDLLQEEFKHFQKIEKLKKLENKINKK